MVFRKMHQTRSPLREIMYVYPDLKKSPRRRPRAYTGGTLTQ
jgi:hypothetical protein